MSKLCLCQAGYPKSILLDNQVVIIISPSQAKAMNLLWSSYTECNEINSELTYQLEEYRKLVETYDFKIAKMDTLLSVKDERIASRDTLIVSYKENTKRLNKTITWLKTTRAGLGTLFILAIGYIVYDAIKKD